MLVFGSSFWCAKLLSVPMARAEAVEAVVAAERASALVPGPRENEALPTLERDRERIRAAGELFSSAGDADLLLRLVSAIRGPFAPALGLSEDIRNWVRPIAENKTLATLSRARAYANLALQSGKLADHEAELEFARAAYELYEEIGDLDGMAWMLVTPAVAALHDGRLDEAERLYSEVRRLAVAANARIVESSGIRGLISVALVREDYERVDQLADDLEAFARARGSEAFTVEADLVRALTATERGDHDRATDLARSATERHQPAAESAPTVPLPALVAARILRVRGDTQAAATLIYRCGPFTRYFYGYEPLRRATRDSLARSLGAEACASAEADAGKMTNADTLAYIRARL